MSTAGPAAAVESGIVGQSSTGGTAVGHMAAHDKFLLEEEDYEYVRPRSSLRSHEHPAHANG